MDRKNQRDLTVAVVDEDRHYVDALAPLIREESSLLRFYSCGREALRRRMVDRNAVWLINVHLPDMSGFDLYEMLRDHLDGAAVCLVASCYCREDELRTYRAGAAMYACRPVEETWLRESIRRLRSARGIALPPPCTAARHVPLLHHPCEARTT